MEESILCPRTTLVNVGSVSYRLRLSECLSQGKRGTEGTTRTESPRVSGTKEVKLPGPLLVEFRVPKVPLVRTGRGLVSC